MKPKSDCLVHPVELNHSMYWHWTINANEQSLLVHNVGALGHDLSSSNSKNCPCNPKLVMGPHQKWGSAFGVQYFWIHNEFEEGAVIAIA